MIFVTVGTHQQPFTRLLDAIATLPAQEEIIVQYGYGTPPPSATTAVAFLSFPDMLDHFARASTVITHAGVGSILCASRAGHTPIVVPRLKRYGEHVDDHQIELVRALERDGKVIPVWEMGELPAAVAAAPPRRAQSAAAVGPLHEAVRTELHAGGR